jgi:hypothetical protein
MTQNQFAALCARYEIAPEIALENDALVESLRRRDDAEVERILAEEF